MAREMPMNPKPFLKSERFDRKCCDQGEAIVGPRVKGGSRFLVFNLGEMMVRWWNNVLYFGWVIHIDLNQIS